MERDYYVTFYKNREPIFAVWMMALNEICAEQDAVYELEEQLGESVDYDRITVEV